MVRIREKTQRSLKICEKAETKMGWQVRKRLKTQSVLFYIYLLGTS